MDFRFASLYLFALSIIFGLTLDAHAHTTMPDTYISIPQLYKYCPSGECGLPMPCEGQTVKVIGHIDRINILTRSRNPQLLQEKFFIKDNSGASVEVLVIAPDTAPVFEKIFDAQKQGKETILVKGTVVGVDLPMMKSCHRGLRLELHSAGDISFQ